MILSMLRNLHPLKFLLLVITTLFGFILLLSILYGSFYQIETGNKGLVFTNGELVKVADEGLHLKIPFFQDVKKIDVTTQTTTANNLHSASKNMQEVTAGVTVNYHFDQNQLPKIYEQTRFNVEEKIIKPRVQEALKAITAMYDAEQLIVNRADVKMKLDDLLKNDLAKFHIIVDDVQLVHFDFSPEFNKAIEAKQTEVQNALKAKNILDRIKIESEQKIVQAKAEAETIRIQSEAIKAQGGQEYVQLKAISKWDGKLPTTILGNNEKLMYNIPNPSSK